MKVTKCDLCKHEMINYYVIQVERETKTKRCRVWRREDVTQDFLDICDKCMDKIIRATE